MNELIQNVEKWATDKEIFLHGTTDGQARKTLEEARELKDAIEDREPLENIKLELGDVLVTIILQAKMQGFTLQEAGEAAYAKISKRKGQMIDGQFVKQTDL